MNKPNLRAVASAHRWQILAVLFVIVAFSAWGLSNPDYEIFPRWLSPATLKLLSYASIVMLWIASIMLARLLYAGMGFFLMCVLSTMPPINLLAWLAINLHATKTLREAGAKVGFFGASRRSLPQECARGHTVSSKARYCPECGYDFSAATGNG
jgi:hypothetical protein